MGHADQTLGNSRVEIPAWQKACLSLGPVVLAGALGTLATSPNIPTWYADLTKPGFTPPNWAFPVAWTVLYLMMAAAIWRVLSRPRTTPGRSAAIAAFFAQLALNALWSWAFFAFRSPLAGLVVIVLLLAAIIETIRRFARVDRIAAWLMTPYLAWVLYATALNGAIWRLNP
jgi:tryptophan-rich sensory protein